MKFLLLRKLPQLLEKWSPIRCCRDHCKFLQVLEVVVAQYPDDKFQASHLLHATVEHMHYDNQYSWSMSAALDVDDEHYNFAYNQIGISRVFPQSLQSSHQMILDERKLCGFELFCGKIAQVTVSIPEEKIESY